MKSQPKQNYITYRPRQLYRAQPQTPQVPSVRKHRGLKAFLIILAILGLSAFVIDKVGHTSAYRAPQMFAGNINDCQDNKLSQNIVVSIAKQHLWACSFTQTVYSSAVVTGYIKNPADVTPTGTYTIFTKERNVTLTGNDGVTSWRDPVSYWMPFLFNKYGAYGFHDATWRTPNQFGRISTSSPSASHGCVELPLQTAKWLYNWATTGTNVTIRA